MPLDFPRAGVRSLPWRNLAVTSSQVGSQVGLLEVLRWAADFTHHASSPTPLCVDEKIHYRLLKFAYGLHCTDYDFHSLLSQCPPLYGLWHAYKYLLLTILYRNHFPLLTYLTRGTLAEGTPVPTTMRIRSMEMVFAALLRLPPLEQSLERRRPVQLRWRLAVVGSLRQPGWPVVRTATLQLWRRRCAGCV